MPNPTPSPALPVEAILSAIEYLHARRVISDRHGPLGDAAVAQLTALQRAVADAQKAIRAGLRELDTALGDSDMPDPDDDPVFRAYRILDAARTPDPAREEKPNESD